MADETTISKSEKKKEDWMNSKWRPLMGYLYMVVCAFDFIIAPILWSIVQAYHAGGVNIQWQPLTLQGAGLFHLSFGAILGVAAYGRTQEKLNGASVVGTTYALPAQLPAAPQMQQVQQPVTMPAPQWQQQPAERSFGMIPSAASTVKYSKNGKPGPVFEEPEL